MNEMTSEERVKQKYPAAASFDRPNHFERGSFWAIFDMATKKRISDECSSVDAAWQSAEEQLGKNNE